MTFKTKAYQFNITGTAVYIFVNECMSWRKTVVAISTVVRDCASPVQRWFIVHNTPHVD